MPLLLSLEEQSNPAIKQCYRPLSHLLSIISFSQHQKDINQLHLTLNAHIPEKTEQAGELHTFVQG